MLVEGMYTSFVEAFLTIELPEVATRPPDKPGLSLFLESLSQAVFSQKLAVKTNGQLLKSSHASWGSWPVYTPRLHLQLEGASVAGSRRSFEGPLHMGVSWLAFSYLVLLM